MHALHSPQTPAATGTCPALHILRPTSTHALCPVRSLLPGNSLFHVVVETDDVALRCTELLNRGRLGRVTFMPLNQLRPPHVSDDVCTAGPTHRAVCIACACLFCASIP